MFAAKYSGVSSKKDDDLMFYCPLLKKKIYDGDCYEIVHCGYGELKKIMHPEVIDWDEAVSICSKCGNN